MPARWQARIFGGLWMVTAGYLGFMALADGVVGVFWPHSRPLLSLPVRAGGMVIDAWALVHRRGLALAGMSAALLATDRHLLFGLVAILTGIGWKTGGLLRHRPLGIRAVSDRLLHIHVLGPTGSGKSSSVLMPLIAQDLARGHGLVLIEPKGDLSQATVSLARTRARTLVLFDPLLPHCPHYNPLAGPADVAAEGLAWALNQISESGHPFYAVSARVQLVYSVLAVKDAFGEHADLSLVADFLRQDAFRTEVLAQAQDRRVKSYFRDYLGQISPRLQAEQRMGLVNRLELLLLNPALRRVLSGPGDFDWDRALAQKWVVVCPLSTAHWGDSARALASLLWHGLAMATYRRNPAQNPPPVFLYLDEFHQYVTPDLGEFLALARGYGVGLVLAHQDLGQLSPGLKTAVLTNARNRVLLGGLTAEDSRLFNESFMPYPPPTDLRYLPQGRAVVQIAKSGRLTPPRVVRLTHHSLREHGHA